ncbi:MAG: hypothetical protein WCK31_01350 [bacterium]
MENVIQLDSLREVLDIYKNNPGIPLEISFVPGDQFLRGSTGSIVGFHQLSEITEPKKEKLTNGEINITSVNLGGIGGYETFYGSERKNPIPVLRQKLIVDFYAWLEANSKITDVICLQDFPVIQKIGNLQPEFLERISRMGYEIFMIPFVFHETKSEDLGLRAESIAILINRQLLSGVSVEKITLVPHFQNQNHFHQNGDYLKWENYYNIDPINSTELKAKNPFWGQTLFLSLRTLSGRLITIGTFYISPASSAIDRRRTLKGSVEIAEKLSPVHFLCGDTNTYGIGIDTSEPLVRKPLIRSFPFKIGLLTLIGGLTKEGKSIPNLKEIRSLERVCNRLGTRLSVPEGHTLSKGPVKWLLDIGITNVRTSKTLTETVKFTDHKTVSWSLKI